MNYLIMIKHHFQYCLSGASFCDHHCAHHGSQADNGPDVTSPPNATRGTKFPKRFYYTHRGRGSVLLGCCLSHGCKDVAQLLSLPLGSDVCPHPFLDELQGPLVLRDLEQLHGTPLIGGKTAHLSDHVPHELGVFGEALGGKGKPSGGDAPRPGYMGSHLETQLECCDW